LQRLVERTQQRRACLHQRYSDEGQQILVQPLDVIFDKV
jgi:hypothetical protein